MKLTHYIYISAALALLTACHHDEEVDNPVYTVGEADNAIVLTAGVGESSHALTRAEDDTQNYHVPFSGTTQLRLYVEGTWTGKTTVTKYTNCSTGAANYKLDGALADVNDIHPLGSYSTQLYWDDYGTADPNNATNRANGLKVFGVGVDGLSALPSDLDNIQGDSWESLSWSVNTNGENVLQKDLVVSNNHGDNSSSTTTGIKFDQRNSDDKKENLLKFKHMMSKITINLTAQDGFPTTGSDLVGNTVHKFEKAPIFELGTLSAGTLNPYTIVKGSVNVKTAAATGGTTAEDKAVVKAETLASPTKSGVTVSLQALVFPDTQFGTKDDYVIGRLNADDNIYYITAAKIREAIKVKLGESNVNSYKAMSGYNYILNIVVNKTEIHVSATVTNWEDVDTDSVTPEINVSTSYSATGNVVSLDIFNSFSFYRSKGEPFASPAVKHIESGYGKSVGNYFSAEAVAVGTLGSSDAWTFKDLSRTNATPLYWPTHSTHYHMRGVWPETVTTADGAYDWLNPRVSKASNEDNTQVIQIKNVPYVKNTFPSDLMIGAPELSDANKMCTNVDHSHIDQSQYGICATQGAITLNFKYQMAQVEVQLSTSEAGEYDHVNLEGAIVEIVNGYTDGYVTLGECKVVPQTRGSYEMNVTSDNVNYRRSAIVPQPLSQTFDGNDIIDLMFRITIQNSSTPGDTDTYIAVIKNIKAKEGSTYTKELTAWEQGKHYIYKLDIRKTEIKVSASLTDWEVEEASDRVWL